MGNGQGWGRSRRDSLAELGITEEEFEAYAAKKPAGDPDVGAGSLAMGMDVDPATQQAPASQPRPSAHLSPAGSPLLASYFSGRTALGRTSNCFKKDIVLPSDCIAVLMCLWITQEQVPQPAARLSCRARDMHGSAS